MSWRPGSIWGATTPRLIVPSVPTLAVLGAVRFVGPTATLSGPMEIAPSRTDTTIAPLARTRIMTSVPLILIDATGVTTRMPSFFIRPVFRRNIPSLRDSVNSPALEAGS